jgi:hypothetical protein
MSKRFFMARILSRLRRRNGRGQGGPAGPLPGAPHDEIAIEGQENTATKSFGMQTGASDNGQDIAGWGQTTQGNIEAFLVYLGPEAQSCFVDLNPIFHGGMLIMDFGLSTLEPAKLDLYLTTFDATYPLPGSSAPLPVIDPAVSVGP